MKKRIIITLAFLSTFALGFAFNLFLTKGRGNLSSEIKATGIGGVFFKCKDPRRLRDWYNVHLGLKTNDYGAVFEWRQGADTSKKGFTQWTPFAEKTKYFQPSAKSFMINYRVGNVEKLVQQLRKDSVMITDSVETTEYGKFVHILDLEGNKVELWEPNDAEYEKLAIKMGVATTK